MNENNTNYQKGVVWPIYDDKGKVGGIVNWNKIHNRFEYNEGDLAELPFIYFDRNGELQLLEPMSSLTIYIQGKYLNDIRGTENIIYPTVKIGTQYWMREDLRTAKYTDGSAISKKTESTYSKVAAGYFLMNNYYFYNKKAVISEKISPDGWRIADYQDWDMLKYYLNGESSVLKAIDKWDESQYSTTNLTGFNALPAGLFNKISNADESGYAFYNQYVAYWSMGISQNTLSEKAILLNYNSNEIKNASYTDYSGYCIRCVEN